KDEELGPNHPYTAGAVFYLARAIEAQGRYAEAELLYKRSLATVEKVYGPNSMATNNVMEHLARLQMKSGVITAAVPLFRRVCTFRERLSQGAWQGRAEATVRDTRRDAQLCHRSLAQSLYAWSVLGGGSVSTDQPVSLQQEAFTAAQRVALSAAGEALS